METKNDKRLEYLDKREEYMRDVTAEKLGKMISKLRTKGDFTQKEFADKIDLSQPQLSAIESGRQIPTYTTMLKVSKVLNQKPMAFMMRLMAESMVLTDRTSGMLDDEDFEKLGDKVTEQIKQLCIEKFEKDSQTN